MTAMEKNELFVDVAPNTRLHNTIVRINDTSSQSPAILFLHFWGGSNATFDATIASLSPRYSIIAPSFRGWGQSTGPEEEAQYGISHYGNDIVNLIGQLQIKHSQLLSHGLILVGHSMGGKVAQYLLTVAEILSKVRGLVLVAPAPAGSLQLPEDMREQQIHAYDSEDSAAFVLEHVLLGKPDAAASDVKTHAAKMAVAGSLGARQAWPSHGMAEDFESNVVHAVRSRTDSESLPIKVIVGKLDRVETPDNVKARVVGPLADAGAKLEVIELDGVGHLIPLEAPSRLAQLINEFLEKLK